MKRAILFLFVWISCFTSLQAGIFGSAGKSKQPPVKTPHTIRVLILHDVPSAELAVKGEYFLLDPYLHQYSDTRYVGKSKKIETTATGLKWGELFPSLYQLSIKPRKHDTQLFVNDVQYGGSLYVYDVKNPAKDTISIVNKLPIEEYVRSILNSSLNEFVEQETLNALAIIARTNAYYQVINPVNKIWNVDADRVYFRGIMKVSPHIDAAVKSTRHMILSSTSLYEGNSTPFAASFGGMGLGQALKNVVNSKITLQQANEMAANGAHAAQILAKAFPGTSIVLMEPVKQRNQQPK